MNDVNGFMGGNALQVIRKSDAQGEQMAAGGGDFLSGNDEEIVDGFSVLAHETFLDEIVDADTGVVVGDRKAMQALETGLCHHVLGFCNAVRREAGMRVKIEVIFLGFFQE